jgi:hypothetical protein
MKVVYVASPYTLGDVAVNVKRQIDMADTLMSFGYCPIVPLLNHFQHLAHPRPYEDWVKIDNELVLRSDAVLRLSGESKGADAEVKLAISNNIPVVYSIEELVRLFEDNTKAFEDDR